MEHPTFSEFSNRWRRQMAPQWRRLHRQGVDDIFETHLLPRLGALTLTAIDRDAVLELRAALSELPGHGGRRLSAARINKIMTILGQALAEGATRYGLPSPCEGLRPLRASPPDIAPFSLAEVQRLIGAVRPDYHDYLTTRLYTGMRTGEINGLQWDHVDLDHGLIAVRAIYSAGEYEEGGKTRGALRDIPMLPPVREALRNRMSTRREGEDFVFVSPRGNPVDAHNFANRIWYPLLKQLGLKKRRPYQTRHTTATLMLAAGENPEWIARVLGHANTQMLFTVYSRFVPNLTRRDGIAMANLVASSESKQ